MTWKHPYSLSKITEVAVKQQFEAFSCIIQFLLHDRLNGHNVGMVSYSINLS